LDSVQIRAEKSMLDLDIVVLDPPERLESLPKCNNPGQHFGIIFGKRM
jgi:hypothetical protein